MKGTWVTPHGLGPRFLFLVYGRGAIRLDGVVWTEPISYQTMTFPEDFGRNGRGEAEFGLLKVVAMFIRRFAVEFSG